MSSTSLAEAYRSRRHIERDRQDELALRYQRDPSAHDAIVAELLPIVHSIARRYKRGGEPYEDLFQVGSLGLIKALRRFDATRGRRFIAYAVPTITGEIRRHYRDNGWSVHVPRSVQELAQKVMVAEREIIARRGASPSVAELARALERDEEPVLEAWIASRGMRSRSLDAPRLGDQDGEPSYERHLSSVDDSFAAAEARATLAALAQGLSDRERLILTLRYERDLSQREIGRVVGVSQMQVSRLLRRSLTEMESRAAL